MSEFVVHKFGGTSVRGAERLAHVGNIIADVADEACCVVVSAMGGVTDALVDVVQQASRGDESYRAALDAVMATHHAVATALLDASTAADINATIDEEGDALHAVLKGLALLRHDSVATLDFITGHGELWSARLLSAHLAQRGVPAQFVDARQFLTLDEAGQVRPRPSRNALLAIVEAAPRGTRFIITGYIARDQAGRMTTLKRNGSDLSAAWVANFLRARHLCVWTDVDGVLTADPRKVKEAVVTPRLTYAEAAELAYFGAKVLHPSTMAPAIEQNIPIRIKNTFAPERPGSEIAAFDLGELDSTRPVRGFASVDGLALINLEGTGLMGVPGIAERLFRAFSDADISVVLISQASSEHTICVAVPSAKGLDAQKVAERAFVAEIAARQVDRVDLVEHVSVIAAVGEAMSHVPGIAGRFLSALGAARVNVRAVAQGSSERNISVVVDAGDAEKGLRAAHAAFYLSDQTLSVGLIGPGLIGETFLAQVQAQRDDLRARFNIDLRVRAIANSKTMVLSDAPIDLSTWKAALESGRAVDPDAFLNHIAAPHLPHRVIVDCTASERVAARTADWLAQGVHVVTPNKKGPAGPRTDVEAIAAARRQSGSHYFYEATVGAGLPILSTLRELRKTGDRIDCVEGVLSGTLSYLFNTYDGRTPFSALVRAAREQGFTEPDPRDDLSGMDVARKVVILAREMGRDVGLSDVVVESLVPGALQDAPDAESFLNGLAAFDDEMSARLKTAQDAGQVLRFIGRAGADGDYTVQLRALPTSHPFAGLTGSDNVIAFTTARYSTQPLVIRGPGAGPAVTAGGVFADVLRLAAHLGARS